MIETARAEFTPRAPGAIGRKHEHGETIFEFRMPIAAGFLEFVGALARGYALHVIGVTLRGLQGCGRARNFFRIESAKIVDQDIQTTSHRR